LWAKLITLFYLSGERGVAVVRQNLFCIQTHERVIFWGTGAVDLLVLRFIILNIPAGLVEGAAM
jgi:hypothetical protein